MHVDRRLALADRRSSPRAPLVCAVRHQQGQRVQLCLAANISREGMEVWRVRDEPLGEGNPVRLEFEVPGSTDLIAAHGVVVFDRDDLRTGVVGVRFASLPPEHERAIDAFVAATAPAAAPRRGARRG